MSVLFWDVHGTSLYTALMASGSPHFSSLAIPSHLLDASSAPDPLTWVLTFIPLSVLTLNLFTLIHPGW